MPLLQDLKPNYLTSAPTDKRQITADLFFLRWKCGEGLIGFFYVVHVSNRYQIALSVRYIKYSANFLLRSDGLFPPGGDVFSAQPSAVGATPAFSKRQQIKTGFPVKKRPRSGLIRFSCAFFFFFFFMTRLPWRNFVGSDENYASSRSFWSKVKYPGRFWTLLIPGDVFQWLWLSAFLLLTAETR